MFTRTEFFIKDDLTEVFRNLYNSGTFSNCNVNLVFTEEISNSKRKIIISGQSNNIRNVINILNNYTTYFSPR